MDCADRIGVVAIVASQLAAGQRERYLDAEAQRREAVLLHDLTDLLAGSNFGAALDASARRLRDQLDADAAVIVVDAAGVSGHAEAGSAEGRQALRRLSGPMSVLGGGTAGKRRRSGTAGRFVRVVPPYRPPGHAAPRNVVVVPIRGERGVLGQLRVKWRSGGQAGTQARLLDSAAGQLAVAIDREALRMGATEAEVLRRTSELKSALLDAVSHDLRTPLAAILGAADSMLQADVDWSPAERREFLETIASEAERLNRIVGNLLDLSRIQGGTLVPARDWHDPTLVIEESLARLQPAAGDHQLLARIPPDLPPAQLRSGGDRPGHRQPRRECHQVHPTGLEHPTLCRGR